MKILHIISNLGNGGAEKFVIELANELSIKHEVTICCFKKVEDWMIFPKNKHENVNLVSFEKKKGLDIILFFKLYFFLKKERPDIIHFHLDSTVKYVVPLIFLFPKIKFYHTLHSVLTKRKKDLFKNVFRFVKRKIVFICISKAIFKEFSNKYTLIDFILIENGCKKLTATPSSCNITVEVERMKNNTDTKIFLTVGRIDKNKNQQLLLKSFKELLHQNIILLIIGIDPDPNKIYYNKLLSFCPENVHFIGQKSNVSDYLLCSDAFVLSSFEEGMPISIIEALSVGKPVITTPAGGVVDMIEDKKNGFITESFSKEEFSSKILSFLDLNEEDRLKIGLNNVAKFEQEYDIALCVQKHENAYLKCS